MSARTDAPLITRAWAMPAADTFSIPPIAKLLARYIRPGDLVCDPFARNSTLAQLSNGGAWRDGASDNLVVEVGP